MSNRILKEGQKIISIKYSSMEELLNRSKTIRNELLHLLENKKDYRISEEEITSNKSEDGEESYHMNFILTPII